MLRITDKSYFSVIAVTTTDFVGIISFKYLKNYLKNNLNFFIRFLSFHMIRLFVI